MTVERKEAGTRHTAGRARAPLSGVKPGKKGEPARTTLGTALAAALEGAGYRWELAPASAAEELRGRVTELRDRGLLAERLYEEYSDYWSSLAPGEVTEPRSLIVIGWPSPSVKVRFHLDSGPLEAVIPPTYIASAERARCLDLVRSLLGPAGHAVGWARVPIKLLAARTGLAQYGRNNLAYLADLGSYVRLGALCTDADLGAPALQDEAGMVMDRCSDCCACSQACPTGCIPEAGTVIDAARCLTEANENEGSWPEWVPAGGHNGLVGCMRCQESCPVNRENLGEKELVCEFDSAETAIVLENRSADELPAELRARLALVDLDEYSPVLGRNLLALRGAAAVRSSG
jgi:epoxyqueuosine reductase